MTVQTNQHDLRTVVQSDSQQTTKKAHHAARIWNRVADRYAAKPIADEEAYANKLAITREYLHPESQVLEIGCGTGSTALAHAQYVKHIYATDVSSRMIEIAKSKAVTANTTNVNFTCSEVNDVILPEASLDAVLMLNVLHVLADWRQQIATSYRILKPGGVLVSSTICMSDDQAFLKIPLLTGRIVGLLPQLSFFSRNELEHALTGVGFEIVHVSQPARKKAVFIVARKPL